MGEISFQDAMQQFLKSSKLKTGVQALQIEEVWEKIMGKTIAKYTEKIQIIGTTLFITSSVAPLKNELLYQKEKIIEMVNVELGEKTIKEVVVRWSIYDRLYSIAGLSQQLDQSAFAY